jgi:signal recognition particle receptor subunit alpha
VRQKKLLTSLFPDQAVYQSLIHLTWIDKLLDNIKNIFVDLYKDQLKSSRARTIEYPFDDYFDKKFHELQDTDNSAVAEELSRAIPEEKKDFLVEANTGRPPPPVPGLLKGTIIRFVSQ